MSEAKRYIRAAYHYYHLDSPIMSDAEFDLLARHLLASYGLEVRDEGLSDILTRDDLMAGTLLLPRDLYPDWAKHL